MKEEEEYKYLRLFLKKKCSKQDWLMSSWMWHCITWQVVPSVLKVLSTFPFCLQGQAAWNLGSSSNSNTASHPRILKKLQQHHCETLSIKRPEWKL